MTIILMYTLSCFEVKHSTVKSNDSLHFQMNSSPVEANNSKSVPFETNNLNINSHVLCLARQKKGLELLIQMSITH